MLNASRPLPCLLLAGAALVAACVSASLGCAASGGRATAARPIAAKDADAIIHVSGVT